MTRTITTAPHLARLTHEEVKTMECVGVQRYWKGWRSHAPFTERFAATQAGAIASVWWHEGLISIEEAMRMAEGKQEAR